MRGDFLSIPVSSFSPKLLPLLKNQKFVRNPNIEIYLISLFLQSVPFFQYIYIYQYSTIY